MRVDKELCICIHTYVAMTMYICMYIHKYTYANAHIQLKNWLLNL